MGVQTAEMPEAAGRSEGLDEFSSEVLAASVMEPARKAAGLSQGRTGVQTTMRQQLEYLANMRQLGRRFVVNYPAVDVGALLWRLIAAVAVASSIAACGLLLCVLALLGTPIRVNPYVSLAVLFVGIALCLTVASAVHGEQPRSRRR